MALRHRLSWTRVLVLLTVLGLGLGAAAWLADLPAAASALWAAAGILGLGQSLAAVVRGVLRRSAGVDIIAVLAIAGALVLGEYLAGAVIGLMLATGMALEEYAANRAQRELSSLLQRAPRTAHRLTGEMLATIPVDDVVAGDILVVKDGDVIPVDGVVTSGAAVLDESALTGESRPVERGPGDQVRSGSVNAGPSFQMRASVAAAASTYAGIVRMVQEAQQSKAPLVRLADRYAQVFVPVTLALAGGAWVASGSAVRALAVLVVATPCPLLLAAPIAMVSGVSRAARRGIVVKGGAPLETLARAEAVYLDKTGTLTVGAPRLERVLLVSGSVENDLLRLAASVDQVSSHVFAAALLKAARERGLSLVMPERVTERAGAGIEGWVDGQQVRAGNFAWATEGQPTSREDHQLRRRALRDGGSVIFVAAEGQLAAAFVFDDPIRAEAPRVIRVLKRMGVRDVVMLTGDHAAVAEAVGAALGVDHVRAELAPDEKVEAVSQAQRERVTLMVGDGINDAPALAAADIGIAMGARGATSSSEAADVVITVDRLDRLVEAIQIARRSRAIALQSVGLGMGLSFVAMGVAAVGLLPPVAGALLQEGIDAAAILNALRALRPGPGVGRLPVLSHDVAAALRREHRAILPDVDRLRELADRMDELPGKSLAAELAQASAIIATIVAHEREDETTVYRDIAREMTGDDPLAAMSRTHQEIFHLARTFDRLIQDLPPEGPEVEDFVDLRRVLYALHAVLRLNIAQEEELYMTMDPGGGEDG